MLNNKEEYPDYPELEIWYPCLHKVHLFEVHRAVLFYSGKDVEWNGQFFLCMNSRKKSILGRLIKESSIIFIGVANYFSNEFCI